MKKTNSCLRPCEHGVFSYAIVSVPAASFALGGQHFPPLVDAFFIIFLQNTVQMHARSQTFSSRRCCSTFPTEQHHRPILTHQLWHEYFHPDWSWVLDPATSCDLAQIFGCPVSSFPRPTLNCHPPSTNSETRTSNLYCVLLEDIFRGGVEKLWLRSKWSHGSS